MVLYWANLTAPASKNITIEKYNIVEGEVKPFTKAYPNTAGATPKLIRSERESNSRPKSDFWFRAIIRLSWDYRSF